MPISLIIDTAGGANFGGYDLRNVGRLHVGGSGLPTTGYVLQATGAALVTGNLRVEGTSTFVGAITGNLSGNATTATTLQTARTIWGQSFNGSANVSGALSGATTGAFSGNVTIGGTLGTGTTTVNGDLTVTGTTNFGSSGTVFSDDQRLNFGTDTDYWFVYNSAGTQLELWSSNVNGLGADGTIWTVDDGTKTLAVTGALTVAGTTTVTGKSTFSGDIELGGQFQRASGAYGFFTGPGGAARVNIGSLLISNSYGDGPPPANGAWIKGAVELQSTLSVTGTSTLMGSVGVGIATSPSMGLRTVVDNLSGTAQLATSSRVVTTSAATEGYGAWSRVDTAAAAYTLTSAYNYYAANPSKGTGSAITTAYGLYVEALTAGGTNYAIYTAGTTPSHFSGAVTTGTFTAQTGGSVDQFYIERTGTYAGKVRMGFGGANAVFYLERDDGAGGYSPGLYMSRAGHLGIGTTDIEAWYAGWRVLEGGAGFLALPTSITDGPAFGFNQYYGADGVPKYKAGGAASRLHLKPNGTVSLDVAPSGTIDTAVSWITALTINNSGNLDITGDLLFDAGSNIHKNSTVGFYTLASAAQGIKVGSLVASNSYGDTAPTNGIYCKGGLIAGSLSLGGATVTNILTGTASHAGASVAGGSHNQTSVTVSGAAVGDAVFVSFNSSSMPQYNYVSSANTVLVACQNPDGVSKTIPAQTIRVWVVKA